jgi:hypothetical protein
VFAENPTISDFKQIFYRVCRDKGVDYDETVVDRLVTQYFRQRGIALRGCHPRDLIDHSLALADYLGEPRRLTDKLLHGACESYFLDDQVARSPSN